MGSFLIRSSGTVTPGINFKRDTTSTSTVTEDACGHSKIIPVLSSISTGGLDRFKSVLVGVMGESWLSTTVGSWAGSDS